MPCALADEATTAVHQWAVFYMVVMLTSVVCGMQIDPARNSKLFTKDIGSESSSDA